jgi:CheY-like chemotaxis protein
VAVLLTRLESQKVKAEIASREKTRFIANISHEIRTPLNAVVGFSNLLSQQSDAEKHLRHIKGIHGSAKSLLALVDGVLEFSRIEAGHIDLEHRPVCLKELVASINGMFSLQAESKGISFTYDIHHDVPPVIMGDENRLRQILINIAGNAIKFTDAGKVAVTLSLDSSAQDGKTIQFSVSDTGIGIKDAVQPFIFDRFRQADDTAQRHYGGTGLGTAIAKHLVELMGGRIGLDSKYGSGSRFWFTIPCELPAARQKAPDDTCTNRPEPLLLSNGSRIRVLVADDSEINRHVFSSMLDFLGVDAIFAESGPVALQKLEDKKSDLVILDVQMPGMSGLDVIRHYHASTKISERIPIMIVTGDATADIQEECCQLGVRTFLTKPVELEKLHCAISGVFRIDNKIKQAG